MQEFPRVLIVNHNPINRERNNGLTVRSLFLGWPQDLLAQIYFPFLTPINSDNSICRHNWAVSPIGVSSSYSHSDSKNLLDAQEYMSTPVFTKIGKMRKIAMRLSEAQVVRETVTPLREVLYGSPYILTRSLLKKLEEFGPDLLYSGLGSLFSMKFVFRLSRELGIPIVPHFGDDWPDTIYRKGLASKALRRRADGYLSAILKRSPIRMVISDMMSAEYQKRYGGSYLTFLNTVDRSLYSENPGKLSIGPVRLVYIGGLHSGRWEALRAIALELRNLNDIGISGHLSIFTYPQEGRRYRAHLAIPPVCDVAGWVPNNEVPGIMESADILVHVESFRGQIPELVKLSISTKIPEYMMAGRCILGFGPGNIASIKYIRDSNSGVTVETENREDLFAAIKKLMRDSDLRYAYGKNAKSVALNKHDSDIQRRLFRAALESAAGSSVQCYY